MSDAAVLMDRIYRRQRAIYDVTRRYYLLGRDRLIRNLAPDGKASVLEIGCGTGRNLIKCARAYPNARLYGLDVSSAMLETARGSLNRAGLDRLPLAQADATVFEPKALFGEEGFDRIFISYSLSMIPVWKAVVRRALSCLKPTGELHIVDFGQQDGLPRWFRAILFRWLAWFSVTPIAEFQPQLQDLATEAGASLYYRELYHGYAVLAVLKRN